MSDTKSEFNINVIAVYALVVLLVSALIVTVVVKMASTIAHSSNPQVDESATARIAPVAKLEVAKAKVAGAAERSGEEIYTVACVACHGSGAAGAPKTGDAAVWQVKAQCHHVAVRMLPIPSWQERLRTWPMLRVES